MKTHIQKSSKEVKWEGRRCVQGLQMYPNSSLIDAQVLFFILLTTIEYSSALNLQQMHF